MLRGSVPGHSRGFEPGSGFGFSNAIMIAIEKQFRIDRTLIFFFQPDRD
jgi:hypothetical protein